MADYGKLLSKYFVFYDGLTEREKAFLLSGARMKNFFKGESVHLSGGPCLGVMTVIEGRLRVYILSEEGRDITLYYVEEGETCILSASCILQNISFEVFIDADSDTSVLQISAAVFSELSENNVHVKNFALQAAVNRFSDVMWAFQQILFFGIDKRLAMYLYDEAVRNNSLTVYATHEQIGKAVGTAREVITRMLKEFSDRKLVIPGRSKIEIIDKKGLMAIFDRKPGM